MLGGGGGRRYTCVAVFVDLPEQNAFFITCQLSGLRGSSSVQGYNRAETRSDRQVTAVEGAPQAASGST